MIAVSLPMPSEWLDFAFALIAAGAFSLVLRSREEARRRELGIGLIALALNHALDFVYAALQTSHRGLYRGATGHAYYAVTFTLIVIAVSMWVVVVWRGSATWARYAAAALIPIDVAGLVFTARRFTCLDVCSTTGQYTTFLIALVIAIVILAAGFWKTSGPVRWGLAAIAVYLAAHRSLEVGTFIQRYAHYMTTFVLYAGAIAIAIVAAMKLKGTALGVIVAALAVILAPATWRATSALLACGPSDGEGKCAARAQPIARDSIPASIDIRSAHLHLGAPFRCVRVPGLTSGLSELQAANGALKPDVDGTLTIDEQIEVAGRVYVGRTPLGTGTNPIEYFDFNKPGAFGSSVVQPAVVHTTPTGQLRVEPLATPPLMDAFDALRLHVPAVGALSNCRLTFNFRPA